MDITRALQCAVESYRSPDPNGSNGARGLAPLLGITSGALSHKVSPTYPGAHASPAEIVAIVQHTGDVGPVHALAAACGGAFLPGVAPLAAGDVDGNALIGRSIKEIGEWLVVANEANAAAHLTENRLADLQRELLEMMQQAMQTHAYLMARHQATRPAHVREVRAA